MQLNTILLPPCIRRIGGLNLVLLGCPTIFIAYLICCMVASHSASVYLGRFTSEQQDLAQHFCFGLASFDCLNSGGHFATVDRTVCSLGHHRRGSCRVIGS